MITYMFGKLIEAQSSTDDDDAKSPPVVSFDNFLQLVTSDTQGGERVNWTDPKCIDESYIKKCEDQVEKVSFPGQDPIYPDEHLAHAYCTNYKEEYAYRAEINERYNPFKLRLPFTLEAAEHLYNHTHIKSDDKYASYGDLTKKTAARHYFNFLKEYNRAYILFLKAINQTAGAKAAFIALFGKDVLFDKAKLFKNDLSERSSRSDFPLSLVAYLMLDVVLSKAPEITTAARVRAINFAKECFDIEALIKAFRNNKYGYFLCDKEKVFDLIPRKFVTKDEEKGGTPHNDLFFGNEKIKALFRVSQGYSSVQPTFDSGFSTLLSDYPGEMLQVLHSLLRKDQKPELVFSMLVSLAEIDSAQRVKVFGQNASYRSTTSQQSIKSRTDGVTGKESFGEYMPSDDELNSLNKPELMMRIRQLYYRIYILESEAVDSEYKANKQKPKSNPDPKGYFEILQMDPDTPDARFEEVLKRNYRVLALRYHPDKQAGLPAAEVAAAQAKFVALKAAYDVLLNPESRANYLKSRKKTI